MRRLLGILLLAALPFACSRHAARDELIVYAAVDRNCALPLVRAFEAESGLRLRLVFDNESAKTAGLARRLLIERDSPRADVWWSGESLFTARLAAAAVLAPKTRVSFGARLRVLVFHSEHWKRPTPPTSVRDLARPDLRGAIVLARPSFGTSATHAQWLLQRAPETLRAIAANEPLMVAGNAHVVEAVRRGQALLGLCDSDDALIAMERDPALRFAIPDQEAGGLGVVSTPASAAVVQGAPHADWARVFVRWLASPRAQELLAATPSRNLPLIPETKGPEELPALSELRLATVDVDALARTLSRDEAVLRELFPW